MLHAILIVNLQHFSDFQGGDFNNFIATDSEMFEQ